MFALVDCNNFYASCERVFKPKLNNQPIVVLSNNDGCVIARSNEAKAFGIPMGAPAYQFKDTFAKHNIHVFSSNYALYGDMSARVMDTLATFSPDIEIYSIDEAFLKFNGFDTYFNLQEYGFNIRKTVTQNTGIPISVGFANTKSLAKVANKIAKKIPTQTNHVHSIDTEEKRIKALKWLPIEDVWGIGRQHAKRLQKLNITTAYQFTQLEEDWVKKHMSIVGVRLYNELKGIPCLDLESPASKKNIATTRSFDKNYTKIEDLSERISTFASSCAEKLRKQKSCCNALMVFVLTNYHRKDLPQYSKNIVIKLPYPTNSSITLSKYANIGLKKIFKEGFAYKKAGVIVMDFTPENAKQIMLYDNENPNHQALMHTVDKINHAIGQTKIKLASQDQKRTWKMKQEKLSPCYSTRLSDIIEVNC